MYESKTKKHRHENVTVLCVSMLRIGVRSNIERDLAVLCVNDRILVHIDRLEAIYKLLF